MKTGATTGFSETVGTLALTDNSTIALGTGSHTLTFAASNGVSWTAGKTLTITGWTGGYNGTSGTAGKIFVGSSATGLTASQLSQMLFFDGTSNYHATILSTGEVVPALPTISVTGSLSDFGSALVGSSSTSQSYSVSGSNLTTDITVSAPTTDFQVSKDNTNFGSSVTLTQTNGSVSSTNVFVHFTPQSAGAKSGNVTNASTGATTQNVAVSGTGTLKYRSATSGNWNSTATWQTSTDGVTFTAATTTPTAATADTIEIQTGHTVTVTASVDADQLTVGFGATLSVASGVTFTVADGAGTDMSVTGGTVAVAGSLVNGGSVATTASGGTFDIKQGGVITGNAFNYAVNGTLQFENTSGAYVVNNDPYWPATNGPQNILVDGAGGITMNVQRTISGVCRVMAGITNANNLTINFQLTIGQNGFVTGSPTYGGSSSLLYETSGGYSRGDEWLPGATSGAGYPHDILISSNTSLDLPHGSTSSPFQLSGALTIDSGSSLSMGAMTQPLTVLSNVGIGGTLTLSTATGGDIKVGGNWSRNSSTGTFTPNGRAVTFNGTGAQTVSHGAAGTETFAYLIVDKSSGNLTFDNSVTTNVIVTSPGGGSALQLINAGGIDLNGNGLTLNGSVAGTNILVGGSASPLTRTITGAGTVAIEGGNKSVTNNNSQTLTFDTGVNVLLNSGMDFGSLLSTVNGTLTLGNGGFVNTNPPTYGAASTLVYSTTATYNRGAEWTGATTGPGAPNNVTANTDVDLGSASPGTALQAAGNLDAKSGGRFLMDFTGHEMTAPLSVFGNVIIESGGGGLNLSTSLGGDLKVRGDFTNNGTFTPNNRAVFFEGTATQNVTDGSGTATLPYVRVNKGGGAVVLQSNLTTLGPAGGDSIQFLGTSNVLTLNGKTLTLGSTVGTPPAGSGLSGDGSANLSLQDGGTNGAMGTIAFVSGGQTLGNLTINRTGTNASATLGSNVTVNNALALTSGDIITGSNVLTQSGTSSGTGDVVGNVKRTDLTSGLAAPSKSFGNPNVKVSFQSGTPPTDMTINLVKSVPTGSMSYPNAVQRTYTVTQNGASGFNATLRLHYRDAELNGNTESLLDLWRFNGTAWNRVVKTNANISPLDASNKWIESSAVTQFSPWTLASQPLLPTVARLRETSATAYGDGVLVKWRTGFEVDNLGFRLYRDDGAGRVLVTPSIVAGSALTAGPGVALGAGNSYAWLDAGGKPSSRYYLEDVSTGGETNLTGPFYASGSGTGRSPKYRRRVALDQLGAGAPTQNWQHQWRPVAASANAKGKAAKRPAAQAAAQTASLADGPAVKLLVSRAGWYMVTRAQLEAAGLSPTADPARLQLFASGVEQAIRVNADDWQSGGSIEFYGEGVDKQETDTRVYWLVEGQTAGRRIGGGQSTAAAKTSGVGTASASSAGTSGVGAKGLRTSVSTSHVVPPIVPPDDSGPSFTYTTELKERTVYFSSLLNGETENFFGRVVSSTPGTQTVTVRNLGGGGAGGGEVGQASPDGATLEVALQGVTMGAHSVGVQVNGVSVGSIEFAGREHQSASFGLDSGVVQEGDNQVQLTSAASGDVSLTDYIRITYQHKYRADDDTLRFNAAPGATVSVGGFHSGNVRVVDITDPNNVSELPVELDFDVSSGEASASVQVGDGGTGAHTLLAFADSRVSSVDAALAHVPASLRDESNEADFVIITHPTFADSIAPLADARRAEGLLTKVVSIDDIFDEFSAGEHSAQAVKDFLAWTSGHWKRAPRYVLLVGDGSYDPRNYFGLGSFDLVPAKLIDTSLMETASDSWFADFDGDGLAEMAVGRLPVRTVAEANTVVAKILSYTPPDASHTSALLVADRQGSDGYNFESATDAVQAQLPQGASVNRINRGAQPSASVHSQVVAGVDTGPTVVNWMGHGSVNVWTGDGILSNDDAPTLTNGQHLSLFVMMTCLNGYYVSPTLDSLAEALIKAQNGGAVAAWTSTGITEPDGQAAMNTELYRALFAGAGPTRLGDAMQQARTATTDRDVLRTWVLIGDPTMRWR